MLNHIDLMGRLTRDPELRYTQSNTPVATFTLAVDRDFADKTTGQRPTDFIDCVAWRQTGEFVSKYFSKGSMAVVSGRLQIRDWTDRDGNKRRSAEIVVDNVYFGESKRRDSAPQSGGYGNGGYNNNNAGGYNNGGYNRSGSSSYGSSAPTGGAFSELDDGDGELPF
ncbi:MAG: single-stranded DNA-binding protein [Oscillospiraceae bacterium]|nr:single-stranded DNA-binding protein [Oscillospiraceae bacterium]MCD8322124.1 single-stranded DNA-binding protein [Oscillospiraceae bacterium]